MENAAHFVRDPKICAGETVFRGTRVLLGAVRADLAASASVGRLQIRGCHYPPAPASRGHRLRRPAVVLSQDEQARVVGRARAGIGQYDKIRRSISTASLADGWSPDVMTASGLYAIAAPAAAKP
jgi:hypothetical protein